MSIVKNKTFPYFIFIENNDSIFYCDTTNSNRNSKRNTVCGNLLCESASLLDKDTFIVTSVPNNLDIFSTKCLSDECFDTEDNWKTKNNRITDNHYWSQSNTGDSIANKNFDLAQAFGEVEHNFSSNSPVQQTFQQQKIINSSYSNLTILDYSSSAFSVRSSFGNQFRMMADKQKRNSLSSNRSSTSSTEFSKCNFLLDEISAHFDRSLSILNDKVDADDETDSAAVSVTKEISLPHLKPPQPPPRRTQAKKFQNSESQSSSTADIYEFSDPNRTFDQDPTNLKTCYADSLEQCNFDLTESSNSIHLLEKNEPIRNIGVAKCSTPVKRELIASTPNLFQHHDATSDEYLHSSSAYNSLNPLPQSDAPVQTKGILSAGSKNSLSKGVSFYPYVSEISWHEQSSAETPEEHSDGESR